MRQFVCITENNDWEGESWRFWVPSDDPVLETIKEYIQDKEDFYQIDETLISEEEVDIICKYAREGYMMSDNKVEWVEWPKEEISDEDDDPLYKGMCYRYNKKPEEDPEEDEE